VRTVLGLSKTSTSIGWVLVDGDDISRDPIDHDAFDVSDATATVPAAIACRVRDIATATGYTVDSVHVTTSGNPSSLRDALTGSGFADVVSVSLPDATRTWVMVAARATAHQRIAVCLLGRDSASLSVIETSSGATQAATTIVSHARNSLVDWLNTTFGVNGSRPEVLYLIGPRAKLDALAGPLDAALRMPVIATHDAQLALARGAAFTMAHHVDDTAARERPGLALPAGPLGVVAAVAFGSVLMLSAASAPLHLTDRGSHRAEGPPPPPPAAELPTSAAPVDPAPTAPDVPAPAWNPEPAPAHSYAVTSRPAAGSAAPPEQHVADLQPVEHLPDARPAAPGPLAPAPAPVPPSPEPAPPPPEDPAVPNPLFDALP
jgi:hypothetical protein